MVHDNYTDSLITEIRSLDNGGRRTFFDNWTIDYKIGGGNFGCVYRASCGQERAAIKIVSVDLHSSEDFAKEVKILQRLRSPNIVDIKDCDVISSGDLTKSYMVIRMEKLHPLNIKNMSYNEIIRLAFNMCSALATCHSTRPPILHRDIKPDNILVSDNGIYKLGDFGAAWMFDGTREKKYYTTPLYMPPEVSANRTFDARSDIYSLGLSLYTLFNHGQPAFSGVGDIGKAIKIRLSGAMLPDIPGLSPAIMNILRTACNPNPALRYQNAGQLAAALQYAISQPVHNQPQQNKTRIKQKKKHPIFGALLVIFGSLVAIALIVFVIFFIYKVFFFGF